MSTSLMIIFYDTTEKEGNKEDNHRTPTYFVDKIIGTNHFLHYDAIQINEISKVEKVAYLYSL